MFTNLLLLIYSFSFILSSIYLYYKACCQNTIEMTTLPSRIYRIIKSSTELYFYPYVYHIQAAHSICILPRVGHPSPVFFLTSNCVSHLKIFIQNQGLGFGGKLSFLHLHIFQLIIYNLYVLISCIILWFLQLLSCGCLCFNWWNPVMGLI